MPTLTHDESVALKAEYDWLLKYEVTKVFNDLTETITQACKRFPLHFNPGDTNLVKPERFLLSSPKSASQSVKCMLTLMGDSICEGDLTLKIHKQQSAPIKANIYPDQPWKIQQIQDAGNYLLQARAILDSHNDVSVLSSGNQILDILDRLISSLISGRSSLIVPKKRSLEELLKNQNMKAFKPSLPNDTIVSFYVQAQKLVLGVYHLYVNQSQKLDIGARFQAECLVPWLNEALAYFTISLQLCQQLRAKISVFLQYEELQNGNLNL